ncbi:hypothetical protein [Enterobacter sp. CC120223-11]|uniref:hypothetical protein n=1 Tax=Enterobacter sp. CC120223-11 TaxID=1378073 RepID=UPI000BC48BA9|nr:hypothetical protein [Enterobacter sp. CC120223-11]SNY65817.1 hypothetical protein SAMN02744775_01423 [Enterobacter sp. CC120223-11]
MNIKINFYSWAAFSAYSIVNGLIYSWAFWDKFDINILQYTSIQDLLPSIIFLITLPIAALILYFIFIHYWNKINDYMLKLAFNQIHAFYATSRPYNLKKILDYLYDAMVITGTVLVLIFTPNSVRITIIITLVSFAIYKFTLLKTNFFSELGEYRSVVLLILATIPVIIMLLAEYNADKILSGKDTFIVKSDSLCTSDDNNSYRYIASISDKAFSISTHDGSICISKYNYLKLTREKNTEFKGETSVNKI